MKYNFFLNLIRKVAFIILKCIFFIRVEGKENIPEGPFIICANHRSYLDPVLIILIFDRRVYFMAKSELLKYGGLHQSSKLLELSLSSVAKAILEQ